MAAPLKLMTISTCFEPPTYRSFHVKFHIQTPEALDAVATWWKFNLHIQLAFEELVLELKENFPLADTLKLQVNQNDTVLRLPKIKTKDMTGNWLMEIIEEELGNKYILNLKNPFRIEGVSFH